MTEATVSGMSWAERAADRSPVVQRSRTRGVQQATAIVEAARRLIDIKGPSFTTQELVREAGIALQTFYRYFPGKDHLLLAVIENIVYESCQGYKQAARKLRDPVDRLRFYVTSTLEGANTTGGPSFVTAEHWRLQTLYPQEIERATRPFTALILEDVRAAEVQNELNPGDAEYAAWLVTQLTMAVFHHYDAGGFDEPVQVVADRLWNFCLGALGGSPRADGGRSRAARRRGSTEPRR
jgi:AcrR family transcriptional regulator